MSDPRYYTGEPHWDHDDECSLTNLCHACLGEEEARAIAEAAPGHPAAIVLSPLELHLFAAPEEECGA